MLKVYWPSVKGSDETFWSHEWNKHGTCALSHRDVESSLHYFNKSLELYNQLGVQEVLENANIRPTRTVKNTVNLQEVKKAIESKVGARVYILCQHYNQHNFYGSSRPRGESNFLSGIRVCYNNKFKPIDCKSSFRGCKPQVTYPNFGISF